MKKILTGRTANICIVLSVFCFAFAFQVTLANALSPAEKTAVEWIDSIKATYGEITDYIWDHPELSLDEYKSSAKLIEYLEKNGFTVVKGVAGMETAFVATWGSGKPVIGFLAEYDALPNLSQTPGKIERKPITVGAPGQGCGHHLYGTTSCTAAIATAKAMAAHGIKGTVKLYGTPAEETLMGKVFMASKGVFDEADSVISWHPGDVNGIGNSTCLAMNSAKFQFKGRASHAGTAPEHGRSALDAVELMSIGVNFMREHIIEQARIHAVTTSGGQAPNVVPPFAETWYFVRAPHRHQVEEIFKWMVAIAEGAAKMTQTQVTHDLLAATYEVLPINALCEVGFEAMKRVGPPAFTEEEQKYGEEVVKSLGKQLKGKAYSTAMRGPSLKRKFPDVYRGRYSTDQGNVSWITPTMSFRGATWAYKTPGHSWQLVCQGKSSGAKRAGLQVSKWMAASALALLSDTGLIEKAKAEHAGYLKQFPYKDPVKNVPLPTLEKLYRIKRTAVPGRYDDDPAGR
ncbi:MAG: amidohydrolase, partial [Deltaproteobacteria bacterium]|nr:amidohydrolase [Deltaproteobacteria bacterium]